MTTQWQDRAYSRLYNVEFSYPIPGRPTAIECTLWAADGTIIGTRDVTIRRDGGCVASVGGRRVLVTVEDGKHGPECVAKSVTSCKAGKFHATYTFATT